MDNMTLAQKLLGKEQNTESKSQAVNQSGASFVYMVAVTSSSNGEVVLMPEVEATEEWDGEDIIEIDDDGDYDDWDSDDDPLEGVDDSVLDMTDGDGVDIDETSGEAVAFTVTDYHEAAAAAYLEEGEVEEEVLPEEDTTIGDDIDDGDATDLPDVGEADEDDLAGEDAEIVDIDDADYTLTDDNSYDESDDPIDGAEVSDGYTIAECIGTVKAGDRVMVALQDGKMCVIGVVGSGDEGEALRQQAQETADEATEAAEKAQTDAEQAQQAADDAQAAAQVAEQQAQAAQQAAQSAEAAANQASTEAGEAAAKAEEAKTKAESAITDLSAVTKEVETVKEDAAALRTDLEGQIETFTQTAEQTFSTKTELSETQTTLRNEFSESIAGIEATFAQDYAKKTEVDGAIATATASLQSQITANASEISTLVSSVEQTQVDITDQNGKIANAIETATNASNVAAQAQTDANEAQAAADEAKADAAAANTAADNAQTAANEAKSKAELAETELAEAKGNLATAEEKLAELEENAEASAEDIAQAQAAVEAAQTAVQTAQTAANQAKADAAAAQSTADTAKSNAAAAQTAANNAQTSANNAQADADAAQAAADKAQDDVDALETRVSLAETSISQNSTQIELRATKTELAAVDTKATSANDYVNNAKNNYGYQYKYDIVINGDSATYYPVVFRGGDQNVMRDIFITRGYGEQAPAEWAGHPSVYGISLLLKIKCNFGGWGGANYSWTIEELEEMYGNVFASAGWNMSYMAFEVFLRGGGTTGAVYHIYSDQPLVVTYMNGTSPQVHYNQEQIGWSGGTSDNPTYSWNASAPRTLTDSLKDEIAKKKLATVSVVESKITQSADSILLTVSNTYQTQADMSNYSTTAQMNSAIDAKASSITSTVQSTYLSKTDAASTYSTKLEVTQTSESLTAKITTAQNTADTAKTNAATAQTAANNAAKTATNYLSFSSAGLVVGDMTASTLGRNVLIDSDSVDIRNGTKVLASYRDSAIYLGLIDSDVTTIDLCNGMAQFSTFSDADDWNRMVCTSEYGMYFTTSGEMQFSVDYSPDAVIEMGTRIKANVNTPWNSVYDEDALPQLTLLSYHTGRDESSAINILSGQIVLKSKDILFNVNDSIAFGVGGTGTRVYETLTVDKVLETLSDIKVGGKGYNDGEGGVYIDKDGFIQIQRNDSTYHPYIAFYLNASGETSDGQIRLNQSTGYMQFLQADRYTFSNTVDVTGHVVSSSSVWSGEKRSTSDGLSGCVLGASGNIHVQRNDGNPYVGFYGNGQTSYGAYISYKVDDDSMYFGGATKYEFGYPIYSTSLHLSNSITIGRTDTADSLSDRAISTVWKDGSNHYIVERDGDGLTSAFGWAGSSTYATVTKIRGRTCQYQNSSGTTALSDERLKADFENLDRWSGFFDSLEPFAFKMKNGSSGRFHFGFKAQQFEQALLDNGLTTQDCAAFVRMIYRPDKDDPEGNAVFEAAGIKEGDYYYGIIYTELIALNVYQVQALKAEMKEVKEELQRMKNAS